MQSFKDTAGRTWSIEINLPNRKRVKADTGFDVFGVFDQANLSALGDDPETLVGVLYSLCADQIGKLGLTPEQFAGAFDGDTLDAATDAVMEAIADFFPKRRQIMKDLLAKSRQTVTLATEQMQTAVNKITPEQLLRAMSKGAATSLPESSASTPEPSPSDS